MKTFATSVLYVASIALAIGIGIFQNGKEGNVEYFHGSDDNKCTQRVTFIDCTIKTCGEVPKPYSSDVGSVKGCTANFVPNGWCLKDKENDDDDCSDSQPTLSCNTDCEQG